MAEDWLQNLVNKNKAKTRPGQNRPLRRKSLLSETVDQTIGRTFYPESTGKAAAQRMAAAQRQDAAHKAQQTDEIHVSAEVRPNTPPPSVFGKPKAPSFETKVSVPNTFSEKKYPQKYNPSFFHEDAFTPLPGEKQVRVPKNDVSASPKLEQRVLNILKTQRLGDMTRLHRKEQSWILKKDGTNEHREGLDPHRSICSRSEEGCLHIHPEDPFGLDKKTGLRPDGQTADHGHRNKFGGNDWVPVESGVPNFIVGPAGDLWVMEAKDGEYVTRQIKSRKELFGD